MKDLAPHTLQVFEAVSKLDCIKSYLLVGGTALSLQMGTRQSEDLDFMKWRTSKTENGSGMVSDRETIVKQQLHIRAKSGQCKKLRGKFINCYLCFQIHSLWS